MGKKTKKRRRRPRAKPAHHSSQSTAMVKLEKPEPPASLAVRPGFSIAPKIIQTAHDVEQIRRFVSQMLNVDYRKKRAQFEEKCRIENRRLKPEELEILADLEIDYGTIPGSKPFLKQPGAEKFMLWLTLRPKYHKQTNELGEGHFEEICYVTFQVKGSPEEVFEGPECSCTTMETNFRFVWAEAGFQPTEEQERLGYQTKMGQWRWVDRYRNGRRLPDKQRVWFIRIENPNIHNERNNVRQRAQKRALVKGVRNLGAISEIFQAGPDEWDMGPEDGAGAFDSPGVDRDYTQGGRQLYVDGRSPSGSVVTPEKAREEATERRNTELDGKMQEAAGSPPGGAPRAPKGRIEIDWSQEESSPIVRGDLSNVTEHLISRCGAKFGQDSWWHIEPRRYEDLKALAQDLGFQFDEILPKPKGSESRKVSPPMAEPSGATAKRGGSGVHSRPTSQQEQSTPTVVSGTIEQANMITRGKPALDVLFKIEKAKFTMRCFRDTLWPHLQKGVGQSAEIFVTYRELEGKKFTNIVGLKKIGRVEFDTDGKTPIVQKNRPAGSAPDLFNGR